MTLIEQLAAFAANTQYSELPPKVAEECKRDILDAIGCALAAHGQPKAVKGIAGGLRLGGTQGNGGRACGRLALGRTAAGRSGESREAKPDAQEREETKNQRATRAETRRRRGRREAANARYDGEGWHGP